MAKQADGLLCIYYRVMTFCQGLAMTYCQHFMPICQSATDGWAHVSVYDILSVRMSSVELVGFAIVVEYDFADPKLRRPEVTTLVFLEQSFLKSLLDRPVRLAIANIEEGSEVGLRLGTPRVIGAMGELVNAIDNRVGREAEAKLDPYWMMDDRKPWRQFEPALDFYTG